MRGHRAGPDDPTMRELPCAWECMVLCIAVLMPSRLYAVSFCLFFSLRRLCGMQQHHQYVVGCQIMTPLWGRIGAIKCASFLLLFMLYVLLVVKQPNFVIPSFKLPMLSLAVLLIDEHSMCCIGGQNQCHLCAGCCCRLWFRSRQ